MPLILLCGYPCSGKTTVASILAESIRGRKSDCSVSVICEATVGSAQTCTPQEDARVSIFSDANLEKRLRAQIKSEAERALTGTRPNSAVVIVDAYNNIKGYRYEMFCAAKSMQHRQAILHCCLSRDRCQALNEQLGRFPDAVFSDLVARFEPPNSSSRWENPLYEICLPEGEETTAKLELENLVKIVAARIVNELMASSVEVKPNKSTIPAQTSGGNYLQIFERATNAVIETVLTALSTGAESVGLPERLKIDVLTSAHLDLTVKPAWTAASLAKAKRHYLTFVRSSARQLGTVKRSSEAEAALLFLRFLNSEALHTSFIT